MPANLLMRRERVARIRELVAASLICACMQVALANTADEMITRISHAARSHDVAALRNISGEIDRSPDRRLKAAYFLARYYADPPHGRAAFVDDFPTDFMGFSYLYALAPFVTGRHSTYAFEELAKLAGNGKQGALRKLLLIDSEADGALGEFASGRVDAIARVDPLRVLRELSALPPPKADQVATNPLAWCDSIRAVESVIPWNATVRGLQTKIRNSGGHC